MEQQSKTKTKKYSKPAATTLPAAPPQDAPVQAQVVDPVQAALEQHFQPLNDVAPPPVTQKTPAPTPAVEKKVNKLEKIRLLSDLANACSDEEIIGVFNSKANGEKLYEIFVTAISNEIEVIMNPNQKPKTNELDQAAQSVNVILASLQRIGGTLGAIENGPTIMALMGLLNKLGGAPAPINNPPRGTVPPQPPQGNLPPAPPPPQGQPPINQNFANLDTPNTSGRRGGGLGTW